MAQVTTLLTRAETETGPKGQAGTEVSILRVV